MSEVSVKKEKELKYFSTDKMYKVKSNKKINERLLSYILLFLGLCVSLLAVYILNKGLDLTRKKPTIGYTENGNVDYTVYLKENNYYDKKFLPSGMQYVANLINTVNTKFNYDIKSDEAIDYTYDYKIIGNLQIVDGSDENKIIYEKEEVLKEIKSDKVSSNDLKIKEDIDIDYDKYNNYVNSYKKDYGLSAGSKLLVTMFVNVTGNHKDSTDQLHKSNKLQVTIPLSEQTLGISINTDKISNKGYLTSPNNKYITSLPLAVSGCGLLIIGLLLIVLAVKFHREYVKENIYTITVKKILKEYDRLIVNGNVNIDEHKFPNKINISSFTEMVDASQNLRVPILYYDVIPGEKCFFIIINNDTLYKYRLTKAFLQKKELDQQEETEK